MKLPAFVRFPSLIPACVFFAAIPSVKAATYFYPDASGSIYAEGWALSGNFIEANSLLPGEKTVRFQPLSGSVELFPRTDSQVNVTAPGYTIYTIRNISNLNINEGVIRSVNFEVILSNAARLYASQESTVVARGGNSQISNTNNGWISGANAAIEFTSAGGTITNWGTIASSSGTTILGLEGMQLYNNGDIRGRIVGGGGSFISNSANVVNSGTDFNPSLLAIDLGSIGGVGGSTLQLSDNGFVSGSVSMAGTGNRIDAYEGAIRGNITGVQDIRVMNDGYLSLWGDLNGGSIDVKEGAELRGNGIWSGTTIHLARDSSILTLYSLSSTGSIAGPFFRGFLQIDGNVTHEAGSRIAFLGDDQIRGPSIIRSIGGVYDAREAIIDLRGGSVINNHYVVIEAAGGTILGGGNTVYLNGSADTVIGRYFSTTLINAEGDLVLRVYHDFQGLPGLTENQRSLAAIFDNPLPDVWDSSHRQTDLIYYLDSQTLGGVQAFFASILEPAEENFSQAASILGRGRQFGRLVQDYLAQARGTDLVKLPVGFSNEVLADPSASRQIGGRGNAWGTFSHDWADYESEADGDFDGDVDAFTAGFDYRVLPNLLLGIVADGSQTDQDGPDAESLRAGIYGSFGKSLGFYADWLAAYGTHDWDDSDAESFQASVTAGYAFGDSKLKYGPFGGFEWQRVDVDGVDSGSGLPASVDGFDAESFRALLGFRVDSDFGRFRPYGSIAYAHEFGDDRAVATAYFAGNAFRVQGAEQSSAILLTLGTKVGLIDGLSLDAGYRGDIALGGEGLTVHGASLGLGYEF